MIQELFDDFSYAFQIGRLISYYCTYDRETKSLNADHSLALKLIIFLRILILNFTVYLFLPPFDGLDILALFQTVHSLIISALGVCAFIVNYNSQEFTVRSYDAIVEIQDMLVTLKVPFSRGFNASLKRLVLGFASVFLVAETSAFSYCAWNGVADMLSFLTVMMAVATVYQTLSFVSVLAFIWRYFLAVNGCLEKLIRRGGRWKICTCDKIVVPKEKLCRRHLIRAFQGIHKKLTDACDLWNKAVGIPQMIIYGAMFLQLTHLVLLVFEAIRGRLQYQDLVRISLTAVNVACGGVMCLGFTYWVELTRQAYARTARILHRIYLYSDDRQFIVGEINDFSLQILLKRLTFTANGMFPFDWNLILIAGHGAVTLTVIGMQFIMTAA